MFTKNQLLVDTSTGEKAYCLAIRKNGNVVCAYADSYESAKQRLIFDATHKPDDVKGGIIKYLPKAQRIDLDASRLISVEIYEKAMNSPESKAIREKIETLQAEVDGLLDSIRTKKYEIRQAYMESMQVIKNVKPEQIKNTDTEEKKRPPLVVKK